MTDNFNYYDLFFKFIHTYSPFGFRNIDFNSPLMKQLDEQMEKGNQFFIAADYLSMKIIFASRLSEKMLGIKPEELDAFRFIDATHPDDIQRHLQGRAKLINMAKEIYMAGKGTAFLSTNLRLRNPEGGYSQTLFQDYLYYATIPYKTVFLIQVNTNIDWWKPAKNSFHYYVGNDLKMFRCPDNDLLSKGIPFSTREFEILKLIAADMSSEQIAEKLFISVNTVSTHRKNIIDKAGKHNISEVVYELMGKGLM
jgi:DNA-binding CsgD family transcriptional regulator